MIDPLREHVEPEWAMVTIMFVDIRGFTSFADRSTAQEAVAYLNDFFELVVPIVTRHGGHANKLLGDGLLGVFGVPERHGDHADRALSAGTAIVRAVDAELGDRCRIGVGLNSGLVIVGTVGGGGLTEYGVIGDPVNVAARVESATRELGVPLLLTEATRCLLEEDPGTGLDSHGPVQLKGRSEPVVLYSLPA
ncbi:MAG: adenylate/guanylate cyclase domain-containing protein [Marmoricola sp.]